ncbi:MAG: hypothetical protein KDE58_14375, partial [Caldilineaceae bacterium]|nr:hypothetical protein [Caldilineaceae bacterium]
PVVGGEQDTNIHHFAWMVRNRGVDMLQPDLLYNGGMIRTLRVAQLAAAAGMTVAPHSPKNDPLASYLLHFVAVLSNPGPHHEWRAVKEEDPGWYAPIFRPVNGTVTLPPGAGLGITYDEAALQQAKVL